MRLQAFFLTTAVALAATLVGVAAPPEKPYDPDTDTPAKQRGRALNRLKQLAIAAHGYHDALGQFPLAATVDEAGKPLLSWRVAVLPYLEQEELYRKFKLDEPWDSDHNKKVLAENPMPDVFATPGLGEAKEKETLMQAFAGKGGIFDGVKGTKLTTIVDGTSNTLLFCVAAKGVPWTKPADMTFDADDAKANPAEQLFKSKTGTHYVSFADGSARAIKATNTPETMRALVTAAGGETVSIDE